MKNGVPVVIAGKPNVGKSTLLNALLNEERAIVSEIPGTTRDTVEDEIIIGGINFRFIDTAGIRETVDIIEAKGVERTHQKIGQAKLIIYLVDPEQEVGEIGEQVEYLKGLGVPFIVVVNKSDLMTPELKERVSSIRYQVSRSGVDNQDQGDLRLPTPDDPHSQEPASQLSTFNFQLSTILYISAKNKTGIDDLKSEILTKIGLHSINTDDVLISNIRHLEALQKTEASLNSVLENIDNPVTSDFLATDIKQALYYLGEITGQVTTDDLLETIFSKFCIGK